jgi:polysaccharide deacetylase family protein (PEP-CTERM system associated)
LCARVQGAPNLLEELRVVKPLKNALTVDLEDYYHVSAFADQVRPQEWATRSSRVEANTDRLLDLFAQAGCSATFFTLGWVAERYPGLIRRVAEAGHEIACHSHAHKYVYALTQEEFREDTKRAKRALEDASGREVIGYRAPSFSITMESQWAYQILAELGFVYDSSVFPVRHPNYGIPQARRFPFRVQTDAGEIVEFPMPTLDFYGLRSPFGGGAYLRFLPVWYTEWAIHYVNDREESPVCIYVHPWEIDLDQPRMEGSLTSRMRHYIGLGTVERKLRKLLNQFEFHDLGSLVQEFMGEGQVISKDSFVHNEKRF